MAASGMGLVERKLPLAVTYTTCRGHSSSFPCGEGPKRRCRIHGISLFGYFAVIIICSVRVGLAFGCVAWPGETRVRMRVRMRVQNGGARATLSKVLRCSRCRAALLQRGAVPRYCGVVADVELVMTHLSLPRSASSCDRKVPR